MIAIHGQLGFLLAEDGRLYVRLMITQGVRSLYIDTPRQRRAQRKARA